MLNSSASPCHAWAAANIGPEPAPENICSEMVSGGNVTKFTTNVLSLLGLSAVWPTEPRAPPLRPNRFWAQPRIVLLSAPTAYCIGYENVDFRTTLYATTILVSAKCFRETPWSLPASANSALSGCIPAAS